MEQPGERLRWARAEAGFDSARSAAIALDVPVSTYNSHERAGDPGGRMFSPDEARKYGRRFRVKWSWLLTGEGEGAAVTVPVIGKIGAGGSIDVVAEQVSSAEPLFEIEVPFPVPSDAFALEVTGESMWPRYDPGDVIICTRHSQDPVPLIGWEAAVGTPDGNRYLKRLMRGSDPGRYDLESHNASPIRGVIVSWASEVFGVVRASRWRRLDDKDKRREIRKAVG